MKVYISNREIETIAEGLVRTVYGKTLPRQIDIDRLAGFLGLTVLYESIAEADADKIGFVSDGTTPLTVWRNGQRREVAYPKNTIVLDIFLRRKGEECRRRFTLAHEIGHILLNRADPLHTAACYHRVYDRERQYSIGELHERLSLGETQANALGAQLLMPHSLLTDAVHQHFRSRTIPVYGECVFLPEMKLCLQDMAEELGVSYTAMLIQLRKYGLLEPKDIRSYFERLRQGGCG